MLGTIAPYGLSRLIKSAVLGCPVEIQATVFVVILVVTALIAVKILCSILCRVDYLVATTLRTVHLSPPAAQYWIGDFISRLPRYVAVISLLLVVGTIGYAVLEFWVRPDAGAFLGRARDAWGSLITFLWS